MLHPIASCDRLHRRRRAVAATATLLILGTVTTSWVLSHRHRTATSSTATSPSSASVVVPGRGEPVAPGQASPTLASVEHTADPVAFARAVTRALFDWDTTTPLTPGDLIEKLTTVGDPTGESSTGLVTDVTSYLPTAQAWTGLARYQTRQWIQITSVEVPTLWSTALRQAGPGGFLAGTRAYTVHGVRHRTGVWEGEPVSTAHAVAFTVFEVCGPSYPQCHLLRLSRLNDPLR